MAASPVSHIHRAPRTSHAGSPYGSSAAASTSYPPLAGRIQDLTFTARPSANSSSASSKAVHAAPISSLDRAIDTANKVSHYFFTGPNGQRYHAWVRAKDVELDQATGTLKTIRTYTHATTKENWEKIAQTFIQPHLETHDHSKGSLILKVASDGVGLNLKSEQTGRTSIDVDGDESSEEATARDALTELLNSEPIGLSPNYLDETPKTSTKTGSSPAETPTAAASKTPAKTARPHKFQDKELNRAARELEDVSKPVSTGSVTHILKTMAAATDQYHTKFNDQGLIQNVSEPISVIRSNQKPVFIPLIKTRETLSKGSITDYAAVHISTPETTHGFFRSTTKTKVTFFGSESFRLKTKIHFDGSEATTVEDKIKAVLRGSTIQDYEIIEELRPSADSGALVVAYCQNLLNGESNPTQISANYRTEIRDTIVQLDKRAQKPRRRARLKSLGKHSAASAHSAATPPPASSSSSTAPRCAATTSHVHLTTPRPDPASSTFFPPLSAGLAFNHVHFNSQTSARVELMDKEDEPPTGDEDASGDDVGRTYSDINGLDYRLGPPPSLRNDDELHSDNDLSNASHAASSQDQSDSPNELP